MININININKVGRSKKSSRQGAGSGQEDPQDKHFTTRDSRRSVEVNTGTVSLGYKMKILVNMKKERETMAKSHSIVRSDTAVRLAVPFPESARQDERQSVRGQYYLQIKT